MISRSFEVLIAHTEAGDYEAVSHFDAYQAYTLVYNLNKEGVSMSYTDNKVKVTVVESHCPKYKEGDVIRFIGSEIDKEHSDRICMVAMNALYPFIYAFRRGGNLRNGPYQCTDCGETVKFTVEIDE